MPVIKYLPNTIAAIMLPVASKNDSDELKSFCLSFAIALPLIFMMILPWWFAVSVPLWPVCVSMVLCVIQISRVQLVYPVYCIWMVIASVLSWFNTHLILLLIYSLMIIPIGLCLRVLGKLQFKKVYGERSNYVLRERAPTKENLREPF